MLWAISRLMVLFLNFYVCKAVLLPALLSAKEKTKDYGLKLFLLRCKFTTLGCLGAFFLLKITNSRDTRRSGGCLFFAVLHLVGILSRVFCCFTAVIALFVLVAVGAEHLIRFGLGFLYGAVRLAPGIPELIKI